MINVDLIPLMRGTSQEKVTRLVQVGLRENPKVSATLALAQKFGRGPLQLFGYMATYVLEDLPNTPSVQLDALIDRSIDVLCALRSDDLTALSDAQSAVLDHAQSAALYYGLNEQPTGYAQAAPGGSRHVCGYDECDPEVCA